MPGKQAHVASSLMRVKLASTAGVAFLLALAMTALTLQTMHAAREVESEARQSYERMRSLWALEDSAKRFQKLTYKTARFNGRYPDASIAQVKREFDVALSAVLALPQHHERHREFAATLKPQASAFVALLERAPEIVARMDSLWQTSGYKAVVAELGLLSATYDDFFRNIGNELATAGQQFADATQQSAARQGVVRTLAFSILVFGLLMAVSLFFVLLKRHSLQKANLALAAEDERRKAFLVDASHELRMPVTIIRGEAQVALRQESGARTETVEVLERILTQTHSVTRMLDDLFLISRAEAGGLRMNLQRLDAGGVARGTASDFATLACESGSTVQCEVEPDLPVMADADRLRQVLTALIDNALRHTRDGVRVLVEARSQAGTIYLSVSDDGPGIDPSIAPALFQRFRRGRTRSDGSGLGLSVVRALTEAFGGSVHIEKAAIGGARICLRLPRAPKLIAEARSMGVAT